MGRIKEYYCCNHVMENERDVLLIDISTDKDITIVNISCNQDDHEVIEDFQKINEIEATIICSDILSFIELHVDSAWMRQNISSEWLECKDYQKESIPISISVSEVGQLSAIRAEIHSAKRIFKYKKILTKQYSDGLFPTAYLIINPSIFFRFRQFIKKTLFPYNLNYWVSVNKKSLGLAKSEQGNELIILIKTKTDFVYTNLNSLINSD